MKKPRGFADLGDLPEDERIATVVDYARTHPGEILGVVVDGDDEKAARYARKFIQAGVTVLSQGIGPVPDTIMLRVSKTTVVQ